jgi:ParB/RepB/Spo0J family partition protein
MSIYGKLAGNVGIASQNKDAKMKSLDRKSLAETPIEKADPHSALPSKANIPTQTIATKIEAPDTTTNKDFYQSFGEYYLPSGAKTQARLMFITDPENETVVWEGNPRLNEKFNTTDIDESIMAAGTNMTPAIARRSGKSIEVIDGCRRRSSTIKISKPLLTIVLDNCSDKDAKMLTVLGNEGRLVPTVFSIVKSYKALLDGERPICASITELAKRIGKSRTWVSQLMGVSDFPESIRKKLSQSQAQALSHKVAIKITKNYLNLSELQISALLNKIDKMDELLISELSELIKSSASKEVLKKSKVGTMNIVSRGESFNFVENKQSKGLLIELPNAFDMKHVDPVKVQEEVLTLLKKLSPKSVD